MRLELYPISSKHWGERINNVSEFGNRLNVCVFCIEEYYVVGREEFHK